MVVGDIPSNVRGERKRRGKYNRSQKRQEKKKLSPRQKGNSVNLNNKWKLKFQRIADP